MSTWLEVSNVYSACSFGINIIHLDCMSNLLKFVLFADDTNIFCSSTSLHDLQATINRELAKRFVWFSINRLSLNVGKTNYLFFNSRTPGNVLALTINNVALPRVAATKFLGIIIDDKLSWKPHIQSVKSKLSSVLLIMQKKHLN